MPFLDHLEELRWHLIRSILAIVIAGGAAFLAKDFIFDVLLFGPKKQDFTTYKWICSAAQALGFDEGYSKEFSKWGQFFCKSINKLVINYDFKPIVRFAN